MHNFGLMASVLHECYSLLLVTPKDVSIVVQRRPQDSEPTLIITWKGSRAFQRSSDQHRIVYHVKILRDGRTVWMSTMNQNGTSMALEVKV